MAVGWLKYHAIPQYNPKRHIRSTRAELENIRNNATGKYHLTADIDLSGADRTPISYSGNHFKGVLDGQGHVIRNMTVKGNFSADVGLFRSISGATIKNLGLEGTNINANLTGTDASCGGICGTAFSNSNIVNCYNTGDVTVIGKYAGGICGNLQSGVIQSCFNTGAVSVNNTGTNSLSVGGICGAAYVSASVADHAVGNSIGLSGIMGRSRTNGTHADITSTFVNCYWNENKNQTVRGVPRTYTGTITAGDSAATQTRTGLGNLGLGTDPIPPDDTDALLPADMTAESGFAGFDFGGTWRILPDVNGGFPVLSGFVREITLNVNGGGFIAAAKAGYPGETVMTVFADTSTFGGGLPTKAIGDITLTDSFGGAISFSLNGVERCQTVRRRRSERRLPCPRGDAVMTVTAVDARKMRLDPAVYDSILGGDFELSVADTRNNPAGSFAAACPYTEGTVFAAGHEVTLYLRQISNKTPVSVGIVNAADSSSVPLQELPVDNSDPSRPVYAYKFTVPDSDVILIYDAVTDSAFEFGITPNVPENRAVVSFGVDSATLSPGSLTVLPGKTVTVNIGGIDYENYEFHGVTVINAVNGSEYALTAVTVGAKYTFTMPYAHVYALFDIRQKQHYTAETLIGGSNNAMLELTNSRTGKAAFGILAVAEAPSPSHVHSVILADSEAELAGKNVVLKLIGTVKKDVGANVYRFAEGSVLFNGTATYTVKSDPLTVTEYADRVEVTGIGGKMSVPGFTFVNGSDMAVTLRNDCSYSDNWAKNDDGSYINTNKRNIVIENKSYATAAEILNVSSMFSFKMNDAALLKNAIVFGGRLYFDVSVPGVDAGAELDVAINRLEYGCKNGNFVFNGVDGSGKLEIKAEIIPGFGLSNPYVAAEINTFKKRYLFEASIDIKAFSVGGKLVLAPLKNGTLMADEFAAIIGGEPGIPLIPVAPVAYITKGGAGFSGLVDTINGNYKAIPPIVFDVYGQLDFIKLLSIENARLRVGPSQISFSARPKILGFDLFSKFDTGIYIFHNGVQFASNIEVTLINGFPVFVGGGSLNISYLDKKFSFCGSLYCKIRIPKIDIGICKIGPITLLNVNAEINRISAFAHVSIIGIGIRVEYTWGQKKVNISKARMAVEADSSENVQYLYDENGDYAGTATYGSNLSSVASSQNAIMPIMRTRAVATNAKPVIATMIRLSRIDGDWVIKSSAAFGSELIEAYISPQTTVKTARTLIRAL